MLRPIVFLRNTPSIDFMRWHKAGFGLSILLSVLTVVLFLMNGLNYGIDFSGGIMIEARSTQGPADLAKMREKLNSLNVGDTSLQGFGSPEDVLIRLGRQPGGDAAQMAGVEKVKQAFGDKLEYRRVEVVGPKVGEELIRAGVIATVLALIAIAAYVWFRFEWQFGIAAVATLVHDAILTVGFFALTQIDFNLTSLAAILTIIGYSLNDTVVIFDRIREILRRYKQMPVVDVIDLATNQSLARTIMTSLTLELALLALFFFGGPVVHSFTAAMIWGIFVATASSIFIGGPILIYFNIRARPEKDNKLAKSDADKAGTTAGA